MARPQRLLVVLGLAALVTYMATATGAVRDANPLILALVFAIGPIAIMGVLRLVAALGPTVDGTARSLCRIFLVSAFVLFTAMVVLQQMFALEFPRLIAATSVAAGAETLVLVRKGVNLVQLGLDVAFDVFYCAGLIALGSVLYRHPAFGRLVGLTGVLCGLALLTTNMIAFPRVPTALGLPDLGPLTGLWWLVVIGLQVRRGRRPPAIAVAG